MEHFQGQWGKSFTDLKFHKIATLADVNYHDFIEVSVPAPPALTTWDISLNMNNDPVSLDEYDKAGALDQ